MVKEHARRSDTRAARVSRRVVEQNADSGKPLARYVENSNQRWLYQFGTNWEKASLVWNSPRLAR